MNQEMITIRLDKIYKKLSALESILFYVSMDINEFITNEKDREDLIDSIIYGGESIEGVAELIGDIKNDICLLGEQIEGHNSEGDNSSSLGIPDKI